MTESDFLARCDPAFRSHLVAVLVAMRARGHQPVMIYTWRTLAEQAELYRKGASKVMFSFHNALNEQGQPAALAADIYDARWRTFDDEERAEFYVELGTIAKAHGLAWGGDWARSDPRWAAHGLGWDPGHVQGMPNSALGSVKARTLAAMERARSAGGGAGAAVVVFGVFALGVFGVALAASRR